MSRSAGARGPGSTWRGVPLAIVLTGIFASFAFAYHAAHAPGLFWSRTQVRFVPPAVGKATANDVLTPPPDVIMTAQAVAKIVDPSRAARVSSSSATLAGQGIKHGFSVILPNTGGQWANQFVSPYLDVQVVGTTAQEVNERIQGLVRKIDTTLAGLENGSNVPQKYRIRLVLSPPSAPPLYYEKGSGLRAAVISLVLGAGLTTAAVGASRRRLRPRPAVELPVVRTVPVPA